jgi:hypothetical protein
MRFSREDGEYAAGIVRFPVASSLALGRADGSRGHCTRTIGPAHAASLFSDGFESGTMSAWTTVTAAAGGAVGVETTALHGGTHAAQLSEARTSGSLGHARTQLSGDQTDLTATGAFMVTTEGLANANVPILRFLDATGARAISLYCQNQSGNQAYASSSWAPAGAATAGSRRSSRTVGCADSSAYGVLTVTLHPTGYDFRFVPEAGKTFTDSGCGSCHS